MSDVHSPEQRSYNMSRIRSKNTNPEITVRKFLSLNGFRYRLHAADLPGKPDIIFRKSRLVIFVHGCFWHGHDGCKYYVVPKTRTDWWLAKINKTKDLDKHNHKKLIELGWRVLTVFECELRPGVRDRTLNRISKVL